MSARSGASSWPLGRRHPRDDRLQQLGDADALLGGDREDLLPLGPDQVHDLLRPPLRLGAGEIDLVEDRNDLQTGVHGQEEVAERLRLDPLRRVHHQDRALARGERARDLVGEVHVTRGVDQVELVVGPVPRRVGHPDRVELDGDPALALEVHGVEELLPHLALLHRAGRLDEAVGEGGLAVVDVRDDAEVANAGLGHGGKIAVPPLCRRLLFVVPATVPAHRPALADDLGMLLVVLIWGVNFSVTKGAFDSFPPLAFTGVRFGLASLLLVPLVHRLEGLEPLPRGALVRLVVLGVVGNTLYQLAWISGLERTTASNSALILSSMPTIVAVMAVVLGLEPFRPKVIGGVLVASLGVILVVAARGTGFDATTTAGDLLSLAAVICWAGYTLGLRACPRESRRSGSPW